MEFSDYKQFKDMWKGACESSLGKTPSESALSLAFGVLSGYSYAEVRAATIACLKDSEFKPTPARVLEQLEGGSIEDRARMAWKQVCDAIKKYRSDTSMRFEDKATMWALDCMGGWCEVCWGDAVKNEQIFCRYYATAVRQNIRDVRDHLCGKTERDGSVLYSWDESQIVDVAKVTDVNKGKKIPALTVGEISEGEKTA